jgi:EmrB/QacA subfamily drug resistance transporter
MVTELVTEFTVAGGRPSKRAWQTLAVAALAVFLVSMDGTVLFVAFPSIRRTYADVSPEALSWVLNVYTIGYGALLVPSGRFADRFGRRAFFVGGAAVFTAASLLCGAAPSLALLILARAAQSLGAAMLMPASLALILHAFPAKGRGPAIGIWGATGALAAAIGPALGSAVIQYASWRWVFFLNLPLGLYAVAIGMRRLVESRAQERGALPDLVGAALLMAAFGALAYGIVGAREHPSIVRVAMPAGVILFVLFVVRSLRVPVPALDLRLFQLRSFAVANVMTVVFNVVFTAMFFGNVLFLTERWHRSILEAGLWMSPGPLTVIPVAILAGRLADRIGYRSIFIVGGVLYALGAMWLLRVADQPASFVLWLPGSIIVGAAVGMVIPSLSGASTRELDESTFAVGSAVNQAMRQFGSVLGVAIVVVMVGALHESAPFERIFVLLVVGGLLTALGGVIFPGARAIPAQSPA